MEEKLLRLLERKNYVPLNIPELLSALGLRPNQQQALQATLRALTQSGQIARIKGNRYIKPRDADLVPGIIRMNRKGRGFLQPDDPSQREIVIPESATSTALHNDHVLVRRDVLPEGRKPQRDVELTGAVVRILERKRTEIVGTLRASGKLLYVIPDDPRIPHDVYVPPPRDVGRGANVGDKVVVRLELWESRHTNPEGEIIEVLGPPDAEGVDMLSVLRQHALPLRFPRNVLHEADRLLRESGNGEGMQVKGANRVDCRQQLAVTIDPDDAKDFDDAICVESLAQGRWKVWVHIADVSHFVLPGSVLDTEARKRGNSTYLVDRVIPMLPEALSNDLCSLKPDVERSTKCVEMLINQDGSVAKARFYPAIIRSKRRLTYKEAFSILQRRPAGPIEEMVHRASGLAQCLRRKRFHSGSLNLDFPESKIRLDERGRVDRIERVENDLSHQLVEEFMLLANEAVAARLTSMRRPAIHRIHEPPSERRFQEFREEVLSRNIPCGQLNDRREVQKLLKRLDNLPIGPVLKISFLKSLMRARYSVEPVGHYGLSKEKYAHFTSPIRRYADLVVHRALFDRNPESLQSLKKTADHISETERNSSDAEKASKDVKLFAFLKEQIRSGKPQPYQALVFDMRNFGFFVDVPELGMSGLIHLSSMEDDFYVFDPVRCLLHGRRHRRVIKLGDQIQVAVAKVDSFKRQVDFRLVAEKRRSASQTESGRGEKSWRRRRTLEPTGADRSKRVSRSFKNAKHSHSKIASS